MIEKKNKQAYLIMAHNNIEQLNCLIENLDSVYGDIFLHIDAKLDIRKEDITITKQSKLVFCPSINVYWADYSQVECEIDLLRLALKGKYHYYHLISGADFPLKRQKEIYNFFENKNDIYLHFTTPKNLQSALPYVKYYHYFQKKLYIVNRDKSFSIYKVINKILLLMQKIFKIDRVKKSLEIKKGANWFSIPNDFAEYVIEKENFIQEQFKLTRSPDEFFMQTIAYNSPFRSRIFNLTQDDSYVSCLRYIDWNRGKPYVFKTQDYEKLINTEMIFARKFDFSVDKNIVNKMAMLLSVSSNTKL